MTGGEWVPSFEGQRPPFQPGNPDRFEMGNTAAVQHGAYSERILAPLAESIVEHTLRDPSLAYLREPRYRATVNAWGRAEGKCVLFEEQLERLPDDLADKRVETAHRELHRAETRAATLRSQLGLTPLSRARLGRDVAATQVDMARLLSEAREAQERGEAP